MPTWALLVSVLLAKAPPCGEALQDRVMVRLPTEAGPWWVRCLDDQNLELTRVTAEGLVRVRVVSLSSVSAPLRAEVVLMAAKALLRPVGAAGQPSEEPQKNEATEEERAPPRVPLHVERVELPEDERLEPLTPAWLESPWSRRTGWLGPFIETRTLFFVTHNAWLVGGGAGLEFRGLRVGVRASGSSVPVPTTVVAQTTVQLVSGQVAASLGLACANVGGPRLCARVDAGGGVAFVSGDPKLSWEPTFDAHLVIDARFTAGPFVLGAAAQLGAGLGPQVSFSPEVMWSGFSLGLALHAAWARPW